MAMDAQDRARTVAQWQRENTTTTAFLRSDLVAALAAIDDWVDANQASFNAALPLPFRTAATATQKSDLFTFVLMRRQGRLRADEDG